MRRLLAIVAMLKPWWFKGISLILALSVLSVFLVTLTMQPTVAAANSYVSLDVGMRQSDAELPIGSEVVSKRTKTSKTVYLGKSTVNGTLASIYQATFVGSPEYTWDSSANQYAPYKFQDLGTYYQLQHPWVSVRFADSYTMIYDETFTKVLAYNDFWSVQYQNKQGNWVDAPLSGITRTYQEVADGIKLIRSGTTIIGQRTETYYFKNGSPLKITITQNTTQAQTLQFIWNISGIQAQNIVDVIDNPILGTGKVIGSKAVDTSGMRVGRILWQDLIGLSQNITPAYSSDAQGRKVVITVGTFTSLANGSVTIDPTETFYSDADPESTSVDGRIRQYDAAGLTWADLIAGAGTNVVGDADIYLGWYWGQHTTSNRWQELLRAILLFNTSSLPDNATISAATLSITGMAGQQYDQASNAPTSNIYSASPASNTALATGDFDSLGSEAFSDTPIAYASWALYPTYNDFAFNAAGVAAISTDNVSKFGFRNANYDVSGTTPNWAGGAVHTQVMGWAAEGGAGYKPKLVVTYYTLDITNAPSSKAFGVVAASSTYWSNGSVPAFSSNTTSTNSPSASAGGWTNGSNAYADGGSYANVTSGAPSANETYQTYGYNIASDATITSVRVRLDASTVGTAASQTRVPTSDNTVTGTWTPYPSSPTTRWDKVDETSPDNTNYIVGIANNDNILFNYSAFTVSAGATITNVKVYFTASDNVNGTNKITGEIKVSGTTYINSVNNEPPNAPTWTTFSSTWTQNPNTSANWTVAGVNGIQNFGVAVSDATPDVNCSMVYIEVNYILLADDQIRDKISWDGGSNWSSITTTNLTGSEVTYWDNVTAATAWTPAKLNNGNLVVYVDGYTVGDAGDVRLDWIPVEVIYTRNAVVDGECYFTLTNNSSVSINVTVSMTNFTGGVGWNLTSGAPGENTVRATVFRSGDNSTQGTVLTTGSQTFYNGLAVSGTKPWELKLETGMFTDGTAKTSTITLTATAS